MLVPNVDMGMLAMADMPALEEAAGADRAAAPLKLFPRCWYRWKRLWARIYDPRPSPARFHRANAQTRVRTPEVTRHARESAVPGIRNSPMPAAEPKPGQTQKAGTVARNSDTKPRTTGRVDAAEGWSRKRGERACPGYPRLDEVMDSPGAISLLSRARSPICGRYFCYRAQSERRPAETSRSHPCTA